MQVYIEPVGSHAVYEDGLDGGLDIFTGESQSIEKKRGKLNLSFNGNKNAMLKQRGKAIGPALWKRNKKIGIGCLIHTPKSYHTCVHWKITFIAHPYLEPSPYYR